MRFDHEHARLVVFDIETAPLPDAADYLEPSEAPANYKDPLKIAAYIEEKRLDELAKCSLDVDLCQIVAIGWQRETQATPTVMHAGDRTETVLLTQFWANVCDLHLVGFNCLGFDLPVLLRRSLYLGVEAPPLQVDKYRHPRITDLMANLSYDGKLRFRGLAFYCKRFGIDIPDPLTGADIALAVQEGRWTDVEQHVRADVQKTVALAARLGVFTS